MTRKMVNMVLILALGLVFATGSAAAQTTAGVSSANGWYEGEEIYYLALGIEEGVNEKGENQIYLIGGDRKYQAQVVLHVPGEPGYSPHWNVNVVYTAPEVTLDDILGSPYVSAHYPEALFDDVEDILGAQEAGLVTIQHPGIVTFGVNYEPTNLADRRTQGGYDRVAD